MSASSITSALPWLWQRFDDEARIVLLLVCAVLAVFTWSFPRLLAAVGGQGAAERPKKGTIQLVRNRIAAVALLVASGTVFLEWSAGHHATRALRAVAARRAEKPDVRLTRREVEALIERAADYAAASDITGTQRVIYRWRGVFHTHALHAEYQRGRSRSGRSSEGDSGLDVLTWINDILE